MIKNIRLFVIIISFILIYNNNTFSSNPHNSLILMEEQSDLIATAKVISIIKDNFNIITRIQLLGLIKGNSNNQIINIQIHPIAGHQPYFPINKNVLVFLAYNSIQDIYTTVQLNHGSKVFSNEALNINKNVIDEYLNIKASSNIISNKKTIEFTINWLIKCIKHEETRWIASDIIFKIRNNLLNIFNVDSMKYLNALQKKHLDLIFKYITSTKVWSVHELDIIFILHKSYKSQIRNHLIQRLKTNSIEHFYLLTSIYRLMSFSNDNEKAIIKHIIKKYQNIYYKSKYDKKTKEEYLNKLIKQLLEKVKEL